MRDYFLIQLLLLTCVLSSRGQTGLPPSTTANMRSIMELGTGISDNPLEFDNRYEGVKGSPFIYDGWQEGRLYINDSIANPGTIKVNINARENKVIVQMPQNVIALSNGKFRYVEILSDAGAARYGTFDKHTVTGKGSGRILMQVLFEGDKYSLYKEPLVLFKKADYQGAYSQDIRYDEYIPSQNFYIRINGTYEKLKMKKKKIRKLIPEIRRTKGWEGTELTQEQLVDMLAELSANRS